MKYLDTYRRAEMQEHEVTLDPDFVARTLRSNVIQFHRKKTSAEVNEEVAEQMLITSSDEELSDLCAKLGRMVSEKRDAYYVVLGAYAKALTEQSRRASRG